MATTTEYRVSHWGTASTGWIPLGGLTRSTLDGVISALDDYVLNWGMKCGPFRITKAVTTEELVATYPEGRLGQE